MPYAPLELARLKHWWSHHSAAHSALAIKYMAECDSSNAQLYRSPSQHHTLLVAERQTHGRGQFERVWRSHAGDLTFSIGLRLPLDKIPALSIRVGLALAQTCTRNGWPVQLKWPNDLIGQTDSHKGKLAGILVQTNPSEHSDMRWVVIGVGLNIASRLNDRLNDHSTSTDLAPSAFAPIGLAQIDPTWHARTLAIGARETLLMQLVDAIICAIESAHALPDASLAQRWNQYDLWQQYTVQWAENGTVDESTAADYGTALGINAWGEYRIQPAIIDPAAAPIVTLNRGQIRAYHPITD